MPYGVYAWIMATRSDDGATIANGNGCLGSSDAGSTAAWHDCYLALCCD